MDDIINKRNYPIASDKIWTRKTSSGEYLFHYLSLQNSDLLISVLQTHKELSLKKNMDGLYVHHILARNGYIGLLKKVLVEHTYLIDVLDDQKNHLLHYLVTDSKGVQWLLDKFPDTELNSINKSDYTPIMNAIKYNNYESFKLLCGMKNIKLNAARRNSEVLMVLKSQNCKLEKIKKWIELGLSRGIDVNKNNFDGNYPLLFCYLTNEMGTFDYLLKNGANINNGGFGKNFILFYMCIKKDWENIKKYQELFDYNVKDLRWNNVLMNFILNVDNFTIDEFSFLLTQVKSKNHVNIDGNTVFHLLPNDFFIENPSILKKNCIDIWIPNKKGETVLDSWYEDSSNFRKLIDYWEKGYGKKLNQKRKYNITYLKKIGSKSQDVTLPNKNKNYNNVYSAYIDNLVLYIVYIVNKWGDKIFVPLKDKPINLEIFNLDSHYAKIIKYRLQTKEALSKSLNNFIEYYNKNTYYFPQLPKKFIRVSFYILSVIGESTNHTNIIIIDTVNKVIERFDPEGYLNADLEMDTLLKKLFMKHKQLKTFQYLPTDLNKTSDNLYQLIEVALNDERPGDPVGFCSAWCLWYFELRMKNLEYPLKELYESSIQEIFQLDQSIRDYIRSYSLTLVKYKNSTVSKLIGRHTRNKDFFSDEENVKIKKFVDRKLNKKLNI